MTATYGLATYGDLTYEAAPEVPYPPLRVRELPRLGQTIDVTSPSGKRYRWADDEPDPANVFSGLRTSSTMPGGHESMDCTLPRKPGIDYSDLRRLSDVRVYGPGGEITWSGRLESTPRTSGDEMAVSPSAVGHQAVLEDDKSVAEVYIDRDLGKWSGAGVGFKLASPTYRFTDPSSEHDEAGTPRLALLVTDPWTASSRPFGLAQYASPVPIGLVTAEWERHPNTSASDTNWTWDLLLADTDLWTGGDSSGNLRAAGPGSASVMATAAGRRFARLAIAYAGDKELGVGTEYGLRWKNVVVLGNHGIPLRGVAPRQGVLASDVVAHAVRTFCPTLTVTEGPDGTIRPSTFIIEQLAFDPTTAAEIVRQANRFELHDWAVWDDREFHYHPRGENGKRWRARIGPAQLEETGPTVERLWNSTIVSYQDVDGTARTVGPPGSGAHTESADLLDLDPENPANQLGLIRRDVLSMGVATPASATEVGRRFLQEAKLLDSSGRATLVGHVEDDRGVLYPVSQVRAGESIEFVDASAPSARRIVKTDYTHDTRSCSIDLDQPPDSMAVLLERLGVVLTPLGL